MSELIIKTKEDKKTRMLVNVEFHFCDFCEEEKAKQIWWVFKDESMRWVFKEERIWWVFKRKYDGYLKANMMGL